jgi:hypothetical protein
MDMNGFLRSLNFRIKTLYSERQKNPSVFFSSLDEKDCHLHFIRTLIGRKQEETARLIVNLAVVCECFANWIIMNFDLMPKLSIVCQQNN